ncbi:MAG: flagellar motor protein MotB [Planctomycetota bacterium]
MAREKPFPEPKDDIPAWFMTYSDVITLLMTFFILLLTFATTEPERFEKSISTMFSGGSATGVSGDKMKSIDRDSFVNRLRVPAARIAIRGAEMPPITHEPARETWGKGLRSLDEEEVKHNELTSHRFDLPISLMFNQKHELTAKGKMICSMLSSQLNNLPFRASISYSDLSKIEKVASLMEHLFHTEMVRPGQVSMSFTDTTVVRKSYLRITIERFSQNEQDLFASGLN